jgi:uncharacterized Zn finger protein (UPF0148 family)
LKEAPIMSDDILKIACPDCKNILVVDRKSGKVLEVLKPIIEESTGDRFEDAMLKVKRSTNDLEKKVEQARQREREKMDRLNAVFKEGLEKAKDEGPIKPPSRDWDLD